MLRKILLVTLVLIFRLSSAQDIYIGHINGSTSDISAVGSGSLYFSGNISVAANGIYTNDGIVEVKGDIVNDNSGLAFGTGTLYLTGDVGQTISGSQPLKVYNIVINNTSTGITLSGVNLILSNTITFTDGIITTGSNKFIFNNGASTSGGSDASHVNGSVEKIGNSAFTFPIGDGIKLRSAAISAPLVATDAFSAKYFYSSPTSGSIGSGLNHISSLEKWDILRTSGTSTPIITLSYDPTYSVTGTVADLRVASLITGIWTDMGGTGSGNLVTASSSSNSFGEFTLGSSSNLNPLPVKLISFKANYILDKNGVEIKWVTASEINSKSFVVERSSDCKNWIEIGEIKASGNSSSIINYTFFDNLPFNNTVFYKLKQFDLNGEFEYSTILFVTKISTINDFIISPNPTSTNTTLNYWSDGDEELQLEISNTLGQILLSKNLIITNGGNTIPIEMDQLLPGNYVLKIYSAHSAKVFTKKIIKLH